MPSFPSRNTILVIIILVSCIPWLVEVARNANGEIDEYTVSSLLCKVLRCGSFYSWRVMEVYRE